MEVTDATERCTVIVTPRDLFSVTETCLEQVFAITQIRSTALSARLDRLFLRLPARLRRRFDAWRTGYHTAAR